MMSLNNMVIGIDIDGVISTPYYYLNHFNKLYNKSFTENQCTDYNLRNIYNVTEEEWETKFHENIIGYFESCDIREDASETINKIKLSYDCHFITARSDTQYVRTITENYLKQNNLDSIPLHMLSSHYKVDRAKELKIDLFIEDNGNNALQLANEGIMVLLMDTYYNKEYSHKNIVRVNNWNEIEEILLNNKII